MPPTDNTRKMAAKLLDRQAATVPDLPLATVTAVQPGAGTDGLDLVTVRYAGGDLQFPYMRHYTPVIGDVVALGRWGGQWHIVGCPGGFAPAVVVVNNGGGGSGPTPPPPTPPPVVTTDPFAYRNSLTYGTYEPDASTAGLLNDPNRPLTVYDGDYTVTSAGAVIKDLEIRGQVIIKAANVTVDNCWIRGGVAARTSSCGLVQCSTATYSAVIRDCLIEPQTPDYYTDGFQYCGYTALRCRVRSTVDGFGVFAKTSGGAMNVVIKGCWVENLSKFYPDASHTNGTHNDGIQLQGGNNATIVGNRIDGFLNPATGNTGGVDVNPDGSPKSPSCTQTTSAIMLNANTGPLTNVTISDNYLHGGILTINGLDTQFTTSGSLTGSIVRNQFGPDTGQYGAVSQYGRIGVQSPPSINIPTSGADVNVYISGGSVRVYRGPST